MKRNADKSDKLLSELEKGFGLRVKPLNEYEDDNDEALADPNKDLEIFG